MKVDKAAHCVGTQDPVSNLRWANPAISPWPHGQCSASAPPWRWELLQDWLGLVCSRLGGPRPSVAILAATETKAFRLLRKLAAYSEIFSGKISSFAKRFLSVGPPNTQNLWPMARRCKGIPKTHFHVWHLQMADVCGKCLLSKLFWSKFSSA